MYCNCICLMHNKHSIVSALNVWSHINFIEKIIEWKCNKHFQSGKRVRNRFKYTMNKSFYLNYVTIICNLNYSMNYFDLVWWLFSHKCYDFAMFNDWLHFLCDYGHKTSCNHTFHVPYFPHCNLYLYITRFSMNFIQNPRITGTVL